MHSTSHMTMRTSAIRTEAGCIRRKRPGRPTQRRAAIDEQLGRVR